MFFFFFFFFGDQERGRGAWPMVGVRSSSDAETFMRAATRRTSAVASEYTCGEL